MSVNGFIAGPKGEMDWMTWDWDDALNNYVNSILESVDCIVLGRKLAEGFIPHWAGVAADPDNPEYKSGRIFTDTPKVVFSKTFTQPEPEWNNTTIAKGDLVEEITNLKNQPGNDIYACGGASFVSSLIKHKLIDDFHLFINPAAIGQGLPVFQELEAHQNLNLIESKAFDCGIVVLQYGLKH